MIIRKNLRMSDFYCRNFFHDIVIHSIEIYKLKVSLFISSYQKKTKMYKSQLCTLAVKRIIKILFNLNFKQNLKCFYELLHKVFQYNTNVDSKEPVVALYQIRKLSQRFYFYCPYFRALSLNRLWYVYFKTFAVIKTYRVAF